MYYLLIRSKIKYFLGNLENHKLDSSIHVYAHTYFHLVFHDETYKTLREHVGYASAAAITYVLTAI